MASQELKHRLRLRELTPADWPRLLELNLASVRELSELDEQRLQWILSLAHRSLASQTPSGKGNFAGGGGGAFGSTWARIAASQTA